MATEHLTNVAKFSVYWLQRSPDLVTAFKSWTDKCQPYHDHRFVILAKLYKYIHPHRKNTEHRGELRDKAATSSTTNYPKSS